MKKVPSITTDQMREVDRLMIEEFGIVLLQMMENAGRNLARLAVMQMEGPSSRNALVLAGRGNNGGGGMVAARHLTNMGYRVSVILTSLSGALTGIPATRPQFCIAWELRSWRRMQCLSMTRDRGSPMAM